jgi:hypothetical protein
MVIDPWTGEVTMNVKITSGDVFACFCIAAVCVIAAMIELIVFIPEW